MGSSSTPSLAIVHFLQSCSSKKGMNIPPWNVAAFPKKCMKNGSGIVKEKVVRCTVSSSVSGHSYEETQSTFDYKKGIKNLVDTAGHEIKKLPSEFVLQLPENPLSATHADIPIIDLSGLNGTAEARVSTIEAISWACAQWGFFRIVNHGVEMSLMEDMLRVAEEFFELSLEEKMKYASDDVMSPMRYGTSLNTSRKHTLHWRDYFRHYGHPFEANLHFWPQNPPSYRNVTKEYLRQVWDLTMRLKGAISEGLGLEPDYIEKSLGEGIQILAANYYPPCPEPDKTLGLAAHSDHGSLTILMQNGVSGLQVKHNEQWIAVENVPGTFVVNIGDYLEILSNGKYKSIEHRATVNTQKTRLSIAVGHGPEFSTILGPAAPLVDERDKTQIQPIAYKDYIRLQQSSSIRGKSALEAITTSA